MKKQIFLLIGLISISLNAQIVTNQGASNRAYKYLGAIVVDSTLTVPVRTTETEYTNVAKPGMIRFNPSLNVFQYRNSTVWNSVISDTSLKTVEMQSLIGSGDIDITKTDVGLSNVDNTSDLNKPISTATQTALNLKANLASPTFTGIPAAPTAAVGTNTTQIATAALVKSSIEAYGWGLGLQNNAAYMSDVFNINTTQVIRVSNASANLPINQSGVLVSYYRSSIYGTLIFYADNGETWYNTKNGVAFAFGGWKRIWNSGDFTTTDIANWNAKQAALVSGTNIKTIEGQSLLGSGNIDITKSDIGLSNVDNTSDLSKPISTATQTALDAKQNALVSGTNIKTVGGITLLGSGNVTEVQNSLTSSTTLAPSVDAVNTGLGNKVTKGGDSGPFSVGTNNNTAFRVIHNSSIIAYTTSSSFTIQNGMNLGGTTGNIDFGTSSSTPITFNRTTSLIGGSSGFRFKVPSTASSVNVVDFKDNNDTTISYINAVGDISGNSFIKVGGTSSQFLKADGSVDSNTYVTNSNALLINGNTLGAKLSFGTKDNNTIGIRVNDIERYNLSLTGLGLANGYKIYNLTAPNNFEILYRNGGGGVATSASTSNTAFDIVLSDSSNTSNIAEFISNIGGTTALRAGIRKDGRVFGSDPTATNDFTTKSYVDALANSYTSKTANYTILSSDSVIDLTANSATITLPTAVGISGKRYTVKNSGSGTTLTLNTTSSQTIDGITSKLFNTQYSGCTVVSDGANWKIIAIF